MQNNKKGWTSVIIGIIWIVIAFNLFRFFTTGTIIIGNDMFRDMFHGVNIAGKIPFFGLIFIGIGIFSIISSKVKHSGNCGSGCHTDTHTDNNGTYNNNESGTDNNNGNGTNNGNSTYSDGNNVFEGKQYNTYTPPITLRCPMCSSVVTKEDKFCTNCGNKLSND